MKGLRSTGLRSTGLRSLSRYVFSELTARFSDFVAGAGQRFASGPVMVHCIVACLVILTGREALQAQSSSPLNRPPQPPVGAPVPVAGMGIMAGSVSHDSALVQVRLSEGDELAEGDLRGAWGVVEFSLSSAASEQVLVSHSFPQRDFIARV